MNYTFFSPIGKVVNIGFSVVIALNPFCFKGVEIKMDNQVVVPVDVREMTRFVTDQGEIHIIHEITLGDLLISTLLCAILIFMLISRVIGRHSDV